jgi:hypothetical protein
MSEVIFATGEQIYKAAVAGAMRGYNRSTDDHQRYEQMIDEHYLTMLDDLGDEVIRSQIQENTDNNWRKANLPLSMALVHTHISGKPCEEHARVYLTSNPILVFDIPMSRWNEMHELSKQRFG